jgi:Uma2 family endonuclease
MIAPRQTMTAAEFAAIRPELPEAGRWHELHAGAPVLLEAPDDAHGTTVLNISRALGRWFQSHRGQFMGYACHGPGLVVASDPDTVYVPSMLFFDERPLFGQTDLTIATLIPRLVVDVASSNDRRKEMRNRTLGYINLGVETVWIPDPFKNEVQVIRRNAPTQALGIRQTLSDVDLLPEFQLAIADVFAQPEWWTGKKTSPPQD